MTLAWRIEVMRRQNPKKALKPVEEYLGKPKRPQPLHEMHAAMMAFAKAHNKKKRSP